MSMSMPTPTSPPPSIEFHSLNKTFSIRQRYQPGHRLTPGEAQVLNQVLVRRILRHTSSWVKQNPNDEGLQQKIWEYAEGFILQGQDNDRGKASPFQLMLWRLANEEADTQARRTGLSPEDRDGLFDSLLGDPALHARAEERLKIESEIAERELRALLGETP